MNTFGKRLQWARKQIDGMTQEALANLLGRDSLTVSKWERDAHPPKSRRDYDELAYQLRRSVVWLRDGTGERGDHYIPDPNATDQERRHGVRRTLRKRAPTQPEDGPYPPPGDPGRVDEPGHHLAGGDLVLVARCAWHLLRAKPDLTLAGLVRALPVLYALALRAPDAVDTKLALEILQSLG